MTTTTLTPPDVRDRLHALASLVRTEVVGLDNIIDLLMLALASRSNLFILGEPGIAKTHIVDRVFKRIDAKHFGIQLGKFTTDGEVLGPVDIPGLKQGRQRRNPEGYLPAAELAKLDELPRAGSALINMLLMAIHEREWRNDGRTEPIPLNIIVGLANSGLTGAEDGAFWDRLVLRGVAEDTLDRDGLMALLRLPDPDPNPPTVLTMDDLLIAQSDVRAVPVTDSAYAALCDVHERVTGLGARPSPRRFKQTIRVVQGAAWLEGADRVDVSHVAAAADVLWQTPDQRDDVTRVVIEVCSPGQVAVLELADKLPAIGKGVASLETDVAAKGRSDTDAQARVVDLVDQLQHAGREYRSLLNQGLGDQAVTRLRQVRETIEGLWVRAAQAGYGIPTTGPAFWDLLDQADANAH